MSADQSPNADGWVQSAKNTAGGHIGNAAQATKDYVVGAPKKEETPGFLQQTGTNVMNTAQGAADTVTKSAQGAVEALKNTMGKNNDEKK